MDHAFMYIVSLYMRICKREQVWTDAAHVMWAVHRHDMRVSVRVATASTAYDTFTALSLTRLARSGRECNMPHCRENVVAT